MPPPLLPAYLIGVGRDPDADHPIRQFRQLRRALPPDVIGELGLPRRVGADKSCLVDRGGELLSPTPDGLPELPGPLPGRPEWPGTDKPYEPELLLRDEPVAAPGSGGRLLVPIGCRQQHRWRHKSSPRMN